MLKLSLKAIIEAVRDELKKELILFLNKNLRAMILKHLSELLVIDEDGDVALRQDVDVK